MVNLTKQYESYSKHLASLENEILQSDAENNLMIENQEMTKSSSAALMFHHTKVIDEIKIIK